MSLKNCELFFCFFSHRQAKPTHRGVLIRHSWTTGRSGKSSAQRFQGTFLGGQSSITIGRWVSKDDHWQITAYIGYQHDPEFFCPKACVMSSPTAISKLNYFGFWFTTSNWSTLNSKILQKQVQHYKRNNNVGLTEIFQICLYFKCVSQLSVCSTKHCFGHDFSDLLVVFSINHKPIRNIVLFLENKQSNQQTNKHQQNKCLVK